MEPVPPSWYRKLPAIYLNAFAAVRKVNDRAANHSARLSTATFACGQLAYASDNIHGHLVE